MLSGTGVDSACVSFAAGTRTSLALGFDGPAGAEGSEISRRASTIRSWTRIARSATSSAVMSVVGMGGSTARDAQHFTRRLAITVTRAWKRRRAARHVKTRTFYAKRAALEDVLAVEPPVVLAYDGNDGDLGLDGEVEGALLEREEVVVGAHRARALGEEPE